MGRLSSSDMLNSAIIKTDHLLPTEAIEVGHKYWRHEAVKCIGQQEY